MSPDSTTPIPGRSALIRRILSSIIFVIITIDAWRLKSSNDTLDVTTFTNISIVESFQSLLSDNALSSGVGLVTTDGNWGNEYDEKYKDEDIRILGFTDWAYIAIARAWYTRLAALGYTQHYVVAHDQVSYDNLLKHGMRAIPCIIKNPDLEHRVKGFW